SRTVFELHGSVHRNVCMRCGDAFDLEAMLALDGVVPYCPACGGIVKPDVVLYEEPLNQVTWTGAMQAIRSADMLIVGGTSLTVYPAAGLAMDYSGGRLVLINRDETADDARADVVFRRSIGDVLEALIP